MDKKTILIIDDDPAIVKVLSKHFEEIGATVLSAGSYGDGIAAIKAHVPDVVVIDLVLPDRSGLDVAKDINALPMPRPFLVVLTNSTNVEDIADALDSNVTMFIQKADHDPKDIVHMITTRLEENSKTKI